MSAAPEAVAQRGAARQYRQLVRLSRGLPARMRPEVRSPLLDDEGLHH